MQHNILKMKCLLIVIFMYAYVIQCQDLRLPTNEAISHVNDNNSKVITKRIPVSTPGQCPKDMRYYSDYGLCDCKPQSLYFPLNNSCYEAYKQGPCSLSHYFILPENETVPHCVQNPCLVNGVVLYNNTCYTLKTVGPCPPGSILDVNATTVQVECVRANIELSTIINVPPRECPPGSLRDQRNICREKI